MKRYLLTRDGRFEQWEGDYLVTYRVMHEFRYTATVHAEEYYNKALIKEDYTVIGEWCELKQTAMDRLRDNIRRRLGGECLGYKKDLTLEERTYTVELSRLHRSKIIFNAGRFAPAERRPAYGGWDLH